MSTAKKSLFFSIISTCAILAVLSLPLQAQDAESLSKEINNELRDAQRAFFSGKYEQVLDMTNQIQVKLEQLKSVDSGNRNIKTYDTKLSKLQNDLARRMPGASSAPASTPAVSSTPAKTDSDKLPAGASRCIREIDRAIDKAERSLNSQGSGTAESKIKQAEYEMKSADMYWNDLQKKYPATVTHPDVQAAKERMDTLYAQINSFSDKVEATQAQAAETSEAIEADSAPWIEKLAPYVASRGEDGYNPDKEFIAGYTEDKDDMDHRMKLFAEASNTFAEYQNAQFPYGQSEQLEEIVKELGYKLDTFKDELHKQAELYVEENQKELTRCFEFLAQNDKRTIDGKTLPLLLNDLQLEHLNRNITWTQNLLPGDSRVEEMKSQYSGLLMEQSKWREKMIASITMLADKFKGDEADKIKETAESIVKNNFPDAKILRMTTIKPDWNEERVLEFTDTTQSAVRYRVTRSVTTQVAAKKGDDCFLYSVHVAKDHRSDGSWGGMYGHIMFTDKMLEENVNK